MEIKLGEVNRVEKFTTRTIPGILQNNIVTAFNGVLFASVIALFIIHTFVDALFLLAVTFFNICLGIIEELRAKWALDRLWLMANRTMTVIREGQS